MSNATPFAPTANPAAELDEWFASLVRLCARAFGWHRDRHGEAAALHVLRGQAARLRSSRLAKDGASYTSLCLFLAAACRALGLGLTARHWEAALRDVAEQHGLAPDPDLGLSLGSPAGRFKMLLDDAIDAAGLGPQATGLDDRNRKIALGLAVNWGARTLLAYAAEAKLRRTAREPARHDVAWIGTLARRATAGPAEARSRPARRA